MFRFGSALTRNVARSSSSAPKLKYLIDNQWVESTTDKYIEVGFSFGFISWLLIFQVHNPATQEVISLVPQMTQAEMDAVAESSAKAYKARFFNFFLVFSIIFQSYKNL